MGWFGGNDNKADIYIFYDSKPANGYAYYGGEVVTGRVCMVVKRDGFKAKEMTIVFGGEERTCTHYTTSSGTGKNKKTNHHYVKQQKNVFQASHVLEEFGQVKMDKMRREYPFSFRLPAVLPPSIARLRGCGGWAELTYGVQCTLTTPGMLWSGCISATSPIIICGGPGNPTWIQAPARMNPSSVAVTSCCCIDKGRMTLGGEFEKQVVFPGESVCAKVALKNDSTQEINDVSIRITTRTNWSYRHHTNHNITTCANHDGNPKEFTGAGKIDKREKVKGSFHNSALQDIVASLTTGTDSYKATLTLNHNAPFTYYGSLFTTEASASVTAQTDCCVTNPSIGTRISIVAPQASAAMNPLNVAASFGASDPDPDGPPPPAAGDLPPDWHTTVTKSRAVDLSKAVIMGGQPCESSADQGGAYAVATAVVIPAGGGYEPLLAEMQASVFDRDIIDRHIKQGDAFLKAITASQIDGLIGAVHNIFDRGPILDLLLQNLSRSVTVEDVRVPLQKLEVSSQKTDLVVKYWGQLEKNGQNVEALLSSLSPYENCIVSDTIKRR